MIFLIGKQVWKLEVLTMNATLKIHWNVFFCHHKSRLFINYFLSVFVQSYVSKRSTIELKKTKRNNSVQNSNKMPHKKIVIFFRWAAYEIRHRSTEKLFFTSPCFRWPRALFWPDCSPLRLRCSVDDRGRRDSGGERWETRWVNTFLNHYPFGLCHRCSIWAWVGSGQAKTRDEVTGSKER